MRNECSLKNIHVQILSESDVKQKEIIRVRGMWHTVHETDIIKSNGS